MNRTTCLLASALILGLVAFAPCAMAADKASDDLVQMIVKLIGDSDREFRAAGLDQVRNSAKGATATKAFTNQLKSLPSEAQIALTSALADRGDKTALPAILELIEASKDDGVRAAGILAIGSLGSVDNVAYLVKQLSNASPAEQASSKRALTIVEGDGVPKSIATQFKSASPSIKPTLIEVLAARRASSESATFIAGSVDASPQIRSAAMTALGQLGHADQIAAVLPGVLKAERGAERDNAERNVAMICSRIESEKERGTKLIEALKTVPAADRDELLALVGRVGGPTLIDFVAAIATEDNPARRQIGIDALSKWPDATAADKLMEIMSKATDPAEKHQAFQGFVKICSTRDGRTDKQRLDRMKEAMRVAATGEEASFVINRTRTAYDVESVRFVLPYLEQPQYSQISCETIVEIAHHREVRDPNKSEFDKILDKVIAVAKDPVVVDRAQRYKRGETWERPKK